MNRRDFMVAASGVAGATAAATVATAGTPVAAQEDGTDADSQQNGGDGNESAGGNESADGADGNESAAGADGGGGGTETVEVVDNAFEPEELTIQPGTTVEWVWQSTTATHNVNPTSQPDEAEWEGHVPLESGNFSFESTFDVEGEYDYQCDPHASQGMVGTVVVTTDAGEGAAEADVDIHDIGVPIQKHWMGIATILAISVSLVFTFYLLKYGESAHTSSPGRR